MYSRMREVGQRFYCCSNRRKCRNNIAFWCFGLGNNFSYVIMLSAAVDIIRKQENPEIKSTSNVTENRINCTQIGTGSVLLADILPSMLFKFIAPMFIQRLHFHFKIICAVLLAVNSFLMVSFSQSFFVSLLGIVSASLSSGIGDVSFLSMLAFFDKSCVSAWSSGTGAAGLIGSLVYVGLTAIVTPETTLRIIIIVPCGILIVYFFILNSPHHSKFRCGTNYAPSSVSSSRPTQDLNALNADDADELVDSYMQLTDEDESVSPASPSALQQLHPNWLVKFQLLKTMFGTLVFLISVYFFEYLINQAFFELMYFPNSNLTAPEQYRWYQVLYQLGVFISRSSVSFIHIESTWLLSLLQAINFVIFLLQVMYAYIPYIWIIFILILYEGCLGGLTYVNTFYNIIQRTNTVYREYAMAMAAVSDSVGISGAGFLAIPLHNWLCNRLK